MQAHGMSFSKLIDVDQGAREHFHIPKYQREYSWGKREWDQLIIDIEDNDLGYFMGSVICVNDASTHAPGDEIIFEVVDGQQRLTTLSLLLIAIYSRLKSVAETSDFADEDARQEVETYLRNIHAKLIKRKKDVKTSEVGGFSSGKNTYFLRVQPSGQNHNLDDYKYLLSEVGLIDNQPKQAHYGNRVIARAYYFFKEKIPQDTNELTGLIDKINQLMFVQITVGSQTDAFMLFESLNNRGVPLSAMDIIKNKMLAQMERNHGVDIDESFDRWQKIITAIPDTSEQERFLRHYYNAFKHQDSVRVDKASRATRSQVIRIYETLIVRNVLWLFDDLTSKAEKYGEILHPSSLKNPIASKLEELSRIGSAPAYQVLLYLFSLDNSHFKETDFLVQVTELLCRYFIRRNMTDQPATREMDQIFINLVDACSIEVRGNSPLSFDWFVATLIDLGQPASLEKFTESLSSNIYENNSAMARYVLIQIDQQHHGREYSPDLWLRNDKGHFVWTVEHVLPQTENLPDHWVQMIADGDKQKASEVQDKYVHHLGNLTLSGYNSDLSTAAFEKKQKLSKDRSFLGHKIDIGYKNNLKLNKLKFNVNSVEMSLSDAPTWNEKTIHARTCALVDVVVKANLLPGDPKL
jgi:uncharacterized protein with ParB-like and HNH nuclease domain